MMSFRLSTSLVAATFVFGSTLSSTAGDGKLSKADAGAEAAVQGAAVTKPPRHDDSATQIARLFHQAPIGHRQPRAIDIPESTQVSPAQPEPLDEEINPKLIICRGC
jgi:hypothetical protein